VVPVTRTVVSATAVLGRCGRGVIGGGMPGCLGGFLEAARFLELRQRFCWGRWSVRR
jgi:hypothetical protein